jgi:hypothetical protein
MMTNVIAAAVAAAVTAASKASISFTITTTIHRIGLLGWHMVQTNFPLCL